MADPQNARKGQKLILALTVLVFIVLAVAIIGSCQESNRRDEVINPPDALPESGPALGLALEAEAAPLARA